MNADSLVILLVIALVMGFILAVYNQHTTAKKITDAKHEYFTRLFLWPQGEHTRWEAEQDVVSGLADGVVSVAAEDNYQQVSGAEPSDAEVAFSKRFLGNLSLLLPYAQEGVRHGWQTWFQEELPADWQRFFIIDGFTVPVGGEIDKPWEITLYCEKAEHYFCVAVRDGRSQLLSIDG
ncbi:hypothetical protein [Aliamphritea ceti]|uniref:hypothetical protein n=1 Tax=Aliamphritea ceti TaxID=1524258 RepID=UPI0021C3FBC5|nr:hypothetical protein [Aliamphritea ceti]